MEATIESKAEKENKRTSAIITTVMTLLLLLIFFYPFFTGPDEDKEISGIQVALGIPNTESSGPETGAAPTESTEEAVDTDEASEAASAESEPIASSESSASTKKDVLTSDKESTVNLNKEKEDKAKADKKKADDKKKAEDAKKKAAEDAKKKAEAERIKKEKALKDKKNEFSDFLGGGDGDDDSTDGRDDGKPDASNLDGIATGVGDIGGGLTGRDVVTRPSIKDNSQATGKVVVKVCVNAKGEVISSKFTQQGTTATDLGLIKTAENGVKKYKFSPGELDKQCGTITVNFTLK